MVTGGLQNQISTEKNSGQSAHKSKKLRAISLVLMSNPRFCVWHRSKQRKQTAGLDFTTQAYTLIVQ